MKKGYLVCNPDSGEVFGLYPESQKMDAERRVKNLGPGAKIFECETGTDGKWHLLGKGDAEKVKTERAQIVAALESLGIGGFLYRAVADGWTLEQFQGCIAGASESDLLGSDFRASEKFYLASGDLGEPRPNSSTSMDWNNPRVRAIFGGDYQRFQIYKKHEANIRCIGFKDH